MWAPRARARANLQRAVLATQHPAAPAVTTVHMVLRRLQATNYVCDDDDDDDVDGDGGGG